MRARGRDWHHEMQSLLILGAEQVGSEHVVAAVRFW